MDLRVKCDAIEAEINHLFKTAKTDDGQEKQAILQEIDNVKLLVEEAKVK